MHRFLKAVLLPALASLIFLGAAPAGAAENPQVTVFVYDDAQVFPHTLTRAEQRATKIFSQAGFDITWLDCNGNNGAGDMVACGHVDGPAHLVLCITTHIASTASDAAFGMAFLGADGTGRYGDVFWKRVQQLQETSHVDVAAILGSVMAHEMGHLLLGSNAHAMSGIMQPRWEAGELSRVGMGTLLFMPEQARRMRARMAESMAKATAGRDIRVPEFCLGLCLQLRFQGHILNHLVQTFLGELLFFP